MKRTIFTMILALVMLSVNGQPKKNDASYTITPLIASKLGLFCNQNNQVYAFVLESLQEHLGKGYQLSYYDKIINSFHKNIPYAELVIIDLYEYAGDDAYFLFKKFLYPHEIELTEQLWQKGLPKRIEAERIKAVELQTKKDVRIEELIGLLEQNPNLTFEDLDKYGYSISSGSIYDKKIQATIGRYISATVKVIGGTKDILNAITFDSDGSPLLSLSFKGNNIISDNAPQLAKCLNVESGKIELTYSKFVKTMDVVTEYNPRIYKSGSSKNSDEDIYDLKITVSKKKDVLTYKIGIRHPYKQILFKDYKDQYPNEFIEKLKSDLQEEGKYIFNVQTQRLTYTIRFTDNATMEIPIVEIKVNGVNYINVLHIENIASGALKS